MVQTEDIWRSMQTLLRYILKSWYLVIRHLKNMQNLVISVSTFDSGKVRLSFLIILLIYLPFQKINRHWSLNSGSKGCNMHWKTLSTDVLHAAWHSHNAFLILYMQYLLWFCSIKMCFWHTVWKLWYASFPLLFFCLSYSENPVPRWCILHRTQEELSFMEHHYRNLSEMWKCYPISLVYHRLS